jgi:hypothetical protein
VARKKPKTFTWSYSQLTSFETCPKKHYHSNVIKDFTEPPSTAMTWGSQVHDALDKRISKGHRLRNGLDMYEPLCAKLDKLKGQVITEKKLCLTEGLTPTGYFEDDSWLRAVLDVVVLQGKKALIIDWKTGKRKPDNDQLLLFAGVAFAQWPEIEEVETQFVWLKDKSFDKDTFIRSDESMIWSEFLPRVERYKEVWDTNNWHERPSGLCRGWCPVHTCGNWEPRRSK